MDIEFINSKQFWLLIMIASLVMIITAIMLKEDTRPQIIQDVDKLVRETNKWYIYNLTDDSVNLTDADLRQRGGDCKDWAEYYIRHLNYTTARLDTILIEEREKDINFHDYVVVGNAEAFCIISNKSYKCWRYVK